MVPAHHKMGQLMALNAKAISSFCLSHLAEVSAFKMLSVFFALIIETFMSVSGLE